MAIKVTTGNGNVVRRFFLLSLSALSVGCGHQKLEIAVNAGPGGADVGRMAASEIRQSGAAKNRRVDVLVPQLKQIVQGTSTPKMMAAALDTVANDDKVAVIVSRFLDAEVLQAAQTFKVKGVPFISTTPLPPGITSPNGPGLSMVPNLVKQAQFMAAEAQATDHVAIVHIRNAYGAGLTAALVDALRARGVTSFDTLSYDQSWDEPRMVALGTELEKNKNPSLVYFVGRAPSLELVWQPFREAAKDIRVVASDLVESTAIYDNPEGIFTGLKYVRYFDPQAKQPRMVDLHDRYLVWIGRGEMTGEAVLVYDAMMMTADALRAGARTRAEIRQYFSSLGRSRPPYSGVGGQVSFDENGEVPRKFQLAEVTNRGVVTAGDTVAAKQ